MTNPVVFRTTPVMFGTNPVIYMKNFVIYMTNGVFNLILGQMYNLSFHNSWISVLSPPFIIIL